MHLPPVQGFKDVPLEIDLEIDHGGSIYAMQMLQIWAFCFVLFLRVDC